MGIKARVASPNQRGGFGSTELPLIQSSNLIYTYDLPLTLKTNTQAMNFPKRRMIVALILLE